MHATLVGEEHAVMRRLSRIIERIVAVIEHVATKPATNQVILEFTDGCELMWVADNDQVMPGSIGGYHHCRWRSHRRLIDNHDVPLLVQEMWVEVECSERCAYDLCFFHDLARCLAFRIRQLLVEAGQDVLKESHLLFPGSDVLLNFANARMAYLKLLGNFVELPD